MPIQLHDSLTRTLKPLTASQPDGVFRFYNCGPTVYAPAHIGNFRTFIVNDILRRLLEIEFGPSKVRHVRNLTDVDDRTIQQAHKEGRPLPEITAKWTAKFHADCEALGCLPPHVEPTATGHIREQVDMIECLMERGNAYRAADGSVYFKISSFPEYGALSRIKERELKITNEAADSDHKDSVSDFALWKAYKPEEDGDVQWPGPRGAAAGRPGWHVECSAMIKKHLGTTIDLHTGGVDLLFPHHENEIAQSQCCNGGTTFANHWYHSEHLLVEGTTMSKSKGNYYTLSDLTAKGYSALAVRYALLAGHPRKQLNFTLDSLHAAERALKTLRSYREKLAAGASGEAARAAEKTNAAAPDTAPTTRRQESGATSDGAPTSTPQEKGVRDFFAALCDDLNTPAALGVLFTLVNRGPEAVTLADFDRALFALGLDLGAAQNADAVTTDIPPEVAALAEKRWAAKAAKDWPSADALRAEIAALGWAMLDRKDGYSLEPQKK